jgi:hypothetical protein
MIIVFIQFSSGTSILDCMRSAFSIGILYRTNLK